MPRDHAVENFILSSHQAAFSPFFTFWQKKKSIPPVILFSGIGGIGKKTLSYFLSQWLLCQDPKKTDSPCHTCHSCQQFQEKNEVNFLEILPQENSKVIKLERLRALQENIGKSPFENAFRVILIPKVETLSLEGAECLLKLLEDTPKDWIFFLTTESETSLLKTLLSRCFILRLKAPSQEVLSAFLEKQGKDPKVLKKAVSLSGGSLRKAFFFLNFFEGGDAQKILSCFYQPEAAFFSLLSLIDWMLKDESRIEPLIDLFIHLFSEWIFWSLDPKAPFSSALFPEENALFESWLLRSIEKNNLFTMRSLWISSCYGFDAEKKKLKRPLNRKLFLQNLFLPVGELF